MIKQTDQERGEFSSRWGFILAASGAAVGLGNIWSFPTQAATNGGGAFVIVYLLMAFCLAYPLLMAELTIGRYSKANPIDAFTSIASGTRTRAVGRFAGFIAVMTASLILAFYSIVGGWLIAYFLKELPLQPEWSERRIGSLKIVLRGIWFSLLHFCWRRR
ncbi:MAG: hypothetical protein JKX81_13995 [Arenicella sp.]|nr:hypothetical protein [Arenicella sp.]